VVKGLREVYDLREDPRFIAGQQRTASPGLLDVVREHGAIGSLALWRAIADERIPVHTLEGRISRVFSLGLPGSDWPEFELESDGDRTSWTRRVSGAEPGSREQVERFHMYEVGRFVRLRYVRMRLNTPLPGKEFIQTVLEVWIGGRVDRGGVHPTSRE